MSVLFSASEMEDWATTLNAFYDTNGSAFVAANARSSTRFGGGAEYTFYATSHPFSSNEFWTSFVHYTDTLGTSPMKFFVLWGTGTRRIAIQQTSSSSGTLTAFYWNGSSWTSIGVSGAGTYTAGGVPYKLDVYVKLGNPGVFRLYRNSLPIIAATPDFSFGGLANLDMLEFANNATGANSYYSEVIVATWNTIGAKLVTRVPDANGNYTAWTGSGFGALDEYQPAIDYMTSNAANERASYSFTDFPALAAGEAIDHLRIMTLASRDGGGPANINNFVRISTTDYDSADQALTITQAAKFNYHNTSPATAIAWTVTEMNAAQLGFRSRT